ncbi:MAG: hypothetical protein K2L54_05425, partial [Clostridiales bacterium]|nr:hypothetical protein [Clostridiales bacterium]
RIAGMILKPCFSSVELNIPIMGIFNIAYPIWVCQPILGIIMVKFQYDICGAVKDNQKRL